MALQILRILLNYNLYLKYGSNIEYVFEDSKELTLLYKSLVKLHEKYNRDLTIEEYCLSVLINCQEKDKENLSSLLKDLREIDDSSVVLEDLLRDVSQRQKAHDLALLSLDVAEGRKDFDDLVVATTELTKDKAVNTGDEFEFVTANLDELYEHTVKQQGLRWRLGTLNKMLGSLRKGDLGMVFARPESFSRDTEVLTPDGWVSVDSVTKETKIAQVNADRRVSFTNPIEIHTHDQTHCYRIHDTLGRVDLVVTGGHGMVVEKGGSLHKERADSVVYKQGVKHHVSAAKAFGKTSVLTPHERLQIAYQADGHTRNYKEYGYTFSFKKQTKQDRLSSITAECGYQTTKYKDGNKGNFGFYIKTDKPLSKDFSWVNLENVSSEWCAAFIEELSYWDATRRTDTRYKFDTTNKVVADKVQAIAVLAGFNCFYSVRSDKRKESYRDVYSLTIRTKYVPVDGQSIKKERVPFNDTTYCFVVPTGALLVRRNGAVAVCGNTGKSTFCASEVSHFSTQTDKPILWLVNEEQGSKVMLRLYQAALGLTLQELFIDLNGNKQKYLELTGDRIKVFDSATIHRKQVEQLCRELEPGCIVVDQLDKIKGFTDDREDLRLGSIYIWARELAKQYCPVIAVSQAAASGEGKKYLTMDDVSSAKTAKQAECDWILGIGKSHADADEYIRYFHLSKNKLTGDEDTDPELRHGKAMVRIEPSIARYLDLPE